MGYCFDKRKYRLDLNHFDQFLIVLAILFGYKLPGLILIPRRMVLSKENLIKDQMQEVNC